MGPVRRQLVLGVGSMTLLTAHGQFSEHVIDSVAVESPSALCAADIDGDGDNDVVVISHNGLIPGLRLQWYANDGAGGFTPPVIIQQAVPHWNGEQVEATDLDADADMDLLVAWHYGQRLRPYYNDGSGQFVAGPEAAYVPNLVARSLVVGDFDNSGGPDVVMSGDNLLVLLQNDGSGGFLSPVVIANGSAAGYVFSLCAPDLDLDGDLDLVYAQAQGGDVAWRENLGAGAFGPELHIANTYTNSLNPIHASELDGDGRADIVFRSHVGNAVPANALAWARNDSAGFTTQAIVASSIGNITRVRSADLDVDGDLDLIGAWMVSDEIRAYMNSGSGVFAPAQTITSLCDSVWWITTADMDGDGAPDVVASAMESGIVSWFGQPSITTGPPSEGSIPARLRVHPNPLVTAAVLSADEPLSAAHRIRMFSSDGRLLRTWNGNGDHRMSIDRGRLSTGVYLIRVDLMGVPTGQVPVLVE